MIRFLISAVRAGVVYVDCDGTILEKMPVPKDLKGCAALIWWVENLAPTPVIKKRLPLLYLLRFLGVRLVLWTNRMPRHRVVTWHALDKHMHLFAEFRFRNGEKVMDKLDGPVIDDQNAFLSCGRGHGLLVEPR